jgi:hypothetical protein
MRLVVTVSCGRLFLSGGTNVTPKVGRSYLGCANIPCYNRAVQLAYASPSLPTVTRLPATLPREPGADFMAAVQRTEGIGKPNRCVA